MNPNRSNQSEKVKMSLGGGLIKVDKYGNYLFVIPTATSDELSAAICTFSIPAVNV